MHVLGGFGEDIVKRRRFCSAALDLCLCDDEVIIHAREIGMELVGCVGVALAEGGFVGGCATG